MLSTLRDASKGWVAKILLLLLVLSFAVWGIADQLNGNIGGTTVIEAGNTKVTATEYRLAYDRQISVLSQRLGQRISNEQARLFGIDGQVLGRLVGGAVLDEQARVMKLGLSEDRLASLIAEDEAFQGLSGQFDRGQFRAVLNNVGMREQDYIVSRQQAAIRQQVAEAVSDGMTAPKTFLDALFQFQGQTRDVQYVSIDEQSLAEIEMADDAGLKAFFEENKADYRAPEYRTFKVVTLTAQTLANPDDIAMDDVRAEYDKNQDLYSTPETRTIQQLVFDDKEAANVARERILAGETFEAAVEAAGRSMSDVTLGTFSKADAPSTEIGDAAFELASTTDISPVIDGLFGPILIRVSEIIKEDVKPFAAVSDEIRRDMALVEAQDILLNVHDGYEDARAGGDSLDEAASKQKLEVKTFELVDRQGLDNNGQSVDIGDEKSAIIQAVFEAEENTENQPLNAGRDGFIWYEVTKVEESRDRDFDEVKDRVQADWLIAEKSKQLSAEAERLASAIRDGGDMNALAAEKSYPVESKFGVARNADDADFGNAGVGEIFAVGPQGVAVAEAATGNRRLVFKIQAINTPLGNGETLSDQETAAVNSAVGNDLLDQLVGRLQNEFPVSINQSAIQAALLQ
ncbi:SurA N-terminal domain-containing protein [Ahrensia kielensis]|uniref:Parvulin-like PPIase n=1 Tax=Ahrensia kielensis TaxID=76980 RepID=A0ABU9T417_9HYPH